MRCFKNEVMPPNAYFGPDLEGAAGSAARNQAVLGHCFTEKLGD